MKTKVVVALIGSGASIVAALIGGFGLGKNSEQKSIQNQIDSAVSTVNNVIGDNNEIVINDVGSLVEGYIQLSYDYNELQKRNNSLIDQNTKFLNDLNAPSG